MRSWDVSRERSMPRHLPEAEPDSGQMLNPLPDPCPMISARGGIPRTITAITETKPI
jgi:hypothetical protein